VKAQADYTMPSAGADTGAIVNTAIATGYYNIQLTQGTFSVTSPMLYPLSGFTISGQGMTTILTLANGVNAWMFDTSAEGSNAFRVFITNMRLLGNKTNQNAGGLIRLNLGQNCLVQNCSIESGYAGILLNSTQHTQISGNHVALCTGNGIDNTATHGLAGNNIIYNNDISQNTGVGISVSAGTSNLQITNNLVWFGESNGIDIDGGSVLILITGNLVDHNTLFGIHLGSCAYMTVIGNQVTNNGQTADNSYDGIALTGPVQDFVVSGNVVLSSVANRQRNGIAVNNNCTNGTVATNTISNSGTLNLSIYTANVTFRNNIGGNPVGQFSNPVNTTTDTIGTYGTGTAVVASTDYRISGVDCFVTAGGGVGTAIIVKDAQGNALTGTLTALTTQWLPVGYKINFGAFSVAPWVYVWGN
jgi:parallel beta-helix repeat protein